MKKCSKCKVDKELVEFSKNKSKKDGYHGQCKLCRKQYYKLNKTVLNEKSKQYNLDNADKIKKWLLDNAYKIKQRKKKYRQLNKVAINKYDRQYNLDNIDRIKQYKKQWDIDNPEKYKQWCQTPKGKLSKSVSNNKRRVLLKDNTPIGKNFTVNDIILKLKLQHNKCVYCENSIKDYHEVDHFIPLVKGGSNEASNIQLLCKECNRGIDGKGVKYAHEFAQQHGKLF